MLVKLLILFFMMFPIFANSAERFEKPITIVVSFPPGGDTDVIARILADKLSSKIGQTVIVINKSGASGIIGNKLVSESKPDGTTLLLTPSTLVTSQLIMGDRVGYDVLKDFTPIIEIIKDTPLFIVVNGSLGINSHKDLLEAIRKGRIKTYATPGSGSPMNMVGEYYKKETGVDIIQVPYRGNAPAIIALLANEVEIMVTGLYPILPYLESGRVKIIGVASDKRSRLAPEVPTFNELGLSRADFSGWFALLGPKGMNKNQVQTLNKHLNEVLKDRDVISRINSMAYIISGGSPDDMSKSLEKLYYKFQNNIEKFEIKINEN